MSYIYYFYFWLACLKISQIKNYRLPSLGLEVELGFSWLIMNERRRNIILRHWMTDTEGD